MVEYSSTLGARIIKKMMVMLVDEWRNIRALVSEADKLMDGCAES